MFVRFGIILFHWPHLKFIFNFRVWAPLFTWGQFVLDETERDERGAKPEAKGVSKSPPKRGLITSTRRRHRHRHRHGRYQMANICILIDLVSSLLLSSLHVFRDH